jgi:hypothetical protein
MTRRVVVDTNVIAVANRSHESVSDDCVLACVDRLDAIRRRGQVVVDDDYRILKEYQSNTNPSGAKQVGDVFVKWLLQHMADTRRVHQVRLTETAADIFAEFPDANLQELVDPPDRKFIAVAASDPKRPPILQATDCKWLDWEVRLSACGISIDFLCPREIRRFYASKYPDRTIP